MVELTKSVDVRRGRSVIAVAGSLCVALLLSGCDAVNNFQGPAALAFVDDEVSFAVCKNMNVDKVLAKFRNPDGDWEPFLEANGQATIGYGDVLTVARARSMFTDVVVADEPTLMADAVITIVLYSSDSTSENIVALFDLDGQPLEDGAWRHPDRTSTVEACAALPSPSPTTVVANAVTRRD